MLKKNVIIFFWLFLLVDILLIVFNKEACRIISKPFIVLSLLVWYHQNDSTSKVKTLITLALIFGWLGDLFLMKSDSLFFMLGLVSFLMAHIILTIQFLKIKPISIPSFKSLILSFIIIGIFSFLLIQFLWPHLNELKIPVIIYCLVITSMASTAIHTYQHNKDLAIRNYIPGALFFVVSDALLAFNKFYYKEQWMGVFIMLTYALAFYFLVKGFKQQENY
jgi:uncharacterized membrane protein YhhN